MPALQRFVPGVQLPAHCPEMHTNGQVLEPYLPCASQVRNALAVQRVEPGWHSPTQPLVSSQTKGHFVACWFDQTPPEQVCGTSALHWV